ncbi:kinase-like domain-containing protein [Desarmillaria ectypa]|nr:kinase-like domain-containing protein [Desarmillaria ectypa]
MDATVASLFQSLRVEEAGGLESNASYISEPGFSGRPSILSPHTDISTRPTTYDQLIDYLEMLTVPVIDPENFRLGKGIGSGASFYVQEGRLLLSGLSLCAAVKTPRRSIHKQPHVLSSIIKEVLDEIRVMSHLSMHPNVATLLGVVLEKSGAERLLPRLVVERSIGSLGSLLRKAQTGLPRDLKIRFCLEVAAGIEALHLIDIVHADVKSDNILIFLTTDNWEDSRPPMLTAKVSDFGFCVPDTTVRNRVAATGTLRFKAPESLYGSPPSLRQYANLPQRDLYSFGVLVWEIINDGDLPFSTVRDVDIPSLQLSTEDGAANFLIESSSEQPDSFTKTIRGTVVRNPVKRMAWQEVFASLTSLCDASCTSPNRYFSITEVSF